MNTKLLKTSAGRQEITSKIVLVDDHDEALTVWRRGRFKNLDLVHIDAHMDFGFHPAKPIKSIFNKARSLEELKGNLECSLAFSHYEEDFDKQTNIGNYIYPAMEEGIVKNFYWVIPGGLKEFRESLKGIKNIIRNLTGQRHYSIEAQEEGVIWAEILGRRFIVCVLEKLPILRQKVLLDIDTDFLVIDSIVNAGNTANIGKRKPWILPKDLAHILKNKIKHPEVVTIAYSVNGGYTPMRYKVLGDELAYCLSPRDFKERYGQKFIASLFFKRFASTGKKGYYQKAIKLDRSYRAADNNYGLLYLVLRKFSKAKKEFLKILTVDPGNPFCLCGLGDIALENKDFKKAKGYFSFALKESRHKLFSKAKIQGLLGLAQAEFKLNNLGKAKRLVLSYQAIEPMSPRGYYLLAQIYEKERNFEEAAVKYKDALRLGLNTIDIITRLSKISSHTQANNDIIRYIIIRYKKLKKWFLWTKRQSLKKNRKIKNLNMFEKKMISLEKKLSQKGGGS
jgi:tetratricopeptide (TPR) repeat protein